MLHRHFKTSLTFTYFCFLGGHEAIKDISLNKMQPISMKLEQGCNVAAVQLKVNCLRLLSPKACTRARSLYLLLCWRARGLRLRLECVHNVHSALWSGKRIHASSVQLWFPLQKRIYDENKHFMEKEKHRFALSRCIFGGLVGGARGRWYWKLTSI